MFRRMAQRHLEQLQGLPPDVGGRVKELRDYDFMDPDARQQFEELLKMLQQQILQNYFQGMRQSIQDMTPESLRAIQQMVHDLNQLAEQRLQSQNPDIGEFMQKWGQFFPEGIESFDQLAEQMQRQMAQMESLLNSMPDEMRRQLEEMMDGVLRDHRLRWDLWQLAANLERLNPTHMGEDELPFSGDKPLTLQEALRLMGNMNSMEELEREVRQAMRSNDASRVDADEVGRLLGEEARQLTEQMQQLTRMLEEAGVIRRGQNDWELTPYAIRKIGERALQHIFGKLRSGSFGDHDQDRNGVGIERLEETKVYTFDDPFHLDTMKTVQNAVFRQGAGTPVHIKPEDFEVNRTMAFTRCSTVIALDMSYSMLMAGYFQAGQRVALTLDTLIRTKFPKDNISVVAFSYFVLPLKPSMLLDTYWIEYGGGTNFEEVLRQARRTLAREGGTKQIILITDAQPTMHNSWWGDDYGRRGRGGGSGALKETLQEVARCTKDNITINTFMLGRNPTYLEFVRLMTKMNRGRAFVAPPERLGEYVLWDYVTMRNRVIE